MGRCDWDIKVIPPIRCNWKGIETGGGYGGWNIPPIDVDDDDSDDGGIDDGGGGETTGPQYFCFDGVLANDAPGGMPSCDVDAPGIDLGSIHAGPFASKAECEEECGRTTRWHCYFQGTPRAYCAPTEYWSKPPENVPPHYVLYDLCWYICPGSPYGNTPNPSSPTSPGEDQICVWICDRKKFKCEKKIFVISVLSKKFPRTDANGVPLHQFAPYWIEIAGGVPPQYKFNVDHFIKSIGGYACEPGAKASDDSGKKECEAKCKKPDRGPSTGNVGGNRARVCYWKCTKPNNQFGKRCTRICQDKQDMMDQFPQGDNPDYYHDRPPPPDGRFDEQAWANSFGYWRRRDCEWDPECGPEIEDGDDGTGPTTPGNTVGPGGGGGGTLIDQPDGGESGSSSSADITVDFEYFKCMIMNRPCVRFEVKGADAEKEYPRYGSDTPDGMWTNRNKIDPAVYAKTKGGHKTAAACAKACKEPVQPITDPRQVQCCWWECVEVENPGPSGAERQCVKVCEMGSSLEAQFPDWLFPDLYSPDGQIDCDRWMMFTGAMTEAECHSECPPYNISFNLGSPGEVMPPEDDDDFVSVDIGGGEADSSVSVGEDDDDDDFVSVDIGGGEVDAGGVPGDGTSVDDADVTDGGSVILPAKYLCTYDEGCIEIDADDERYDWAFSELESCNRLCNPVYNNVGEGAPPISVDWVPNIGDFNEGEHSGLGGNMECFDEACTFVATDGMNWVCNAEVGECTPWVDPPEGSRTFTNYGECMNNCHKVVDLGGGLASGFTGVGGGGTSVDIDDENFSVSENLYLRWVCVNKVDGTSYCDLQRVSQPNAGFEDRGRCEINCGAEYNLNTVISNDGMTSMPGWGWTCNNMTGSCEYVLGGDFVSEQDCAILGCHTIINHSIDNASLFTTPVTYGWTCNTKTGVCEFIVNGQYSSRDECNSNCGDIISVNVTPPPSGEGYWRWICGDYGCEFSRVEDPNSGHEEHSKCADLCPGGDDISTSIIVDMDSVDVVNNRASQSSLEPDSNLSASYDESILSQLMLDFLKSKVNSQGVVALDYSFCRTLSMFFVTYPYHYSVVSRSKFINLFKKSINVKGAESILVTPQFLVREFKRFLFTLTDEMYVGLNIKYIHRFWQKMDRRLGIQSLGKVESEVVTDVEGNIITPSNTLIFPRIEKGEVDNFLEPEVTGSDLLNDPEVVTKTISSDKLLESSKAKLEIAINRLASQWRTGLNVISRSRPLKDQEFIPKNLDNVSQIIVGGLQEDRTQLRKVTGDITKSNISINQDIVFQVPNTFNTSKFTNTKFKIDFRSDLIFKRKSNSKIPVLVHSHLSFLYEDGKLVPFLDGIRRDEVRVGSYDSIVMSVTRKATRRT